MAAPLELSYRWQTPVIIASVGAIVLVSLLVRGGQRSVGEAIALVLAAWVIFLAVVWLRTRAYLEVDGPTLTVRRYQERHQLEGGRIRAVREYLTPHGPCYKVYCSGERRPVHVPTGLLKSGHSAFFGWLDAYAPDAELDRGSRRTRDRLRERGLLR